MNCLSSLARWQCCSDDCLGSVGIPSCMAVHLDSVLLCLRLGGGGTGRGRTGARRVSLGRRVGGVVVTRLQKEDYWVG